MKKMIFMALIIILFIPYIGYSYDINWSYTEWGSHSWGDVYDGTNTYSDDVENVNYNAPDVTSSININQPNQTASAEGTLIPDKPGYIYTSVDNALGSPTFSRANAEIWFTGDFIAEYPYLIIDYSYSYDIYAQGRANYASAFNDVGIDLCVFDYDMGAPLYGCGEILFMYDYVEANGIQSISSSGANSGILNISTPIGNSIGVNIRGFEYAYADDNAKAGSSSMYADFSLYASNTVVPEPVSSVLFVIGGGILGGRLFVRKKNC